MRPNTTYHYFIVALDYNNNISGQSNKVTVTTPSGSVSTTSNPVITSQFETSMNQVEGVSSIGDDTKSALEQVAQLAGDYYEIVKDNQLINTALKVYSLADFYFSASETINDGQLAAAQHILNIINYHLDTNSKIIYLPQFGNSSYSQTDYENYIKSGYGWEGLVELGLEDLPAHLNALTKTNKTLSTYDMALAVGSMPGWDSSPVYNNIIFHTGADLTFAACEAIYG